jgi:anti-sigma B factor antagonist
MAAENGFGPFGPCIFSGVASPILRLQTSSRDGTLRLALSGEFDIAGVEKFETALSEAGGEHRELVIDLSGLSFIDSSGIRAILVADRSLRERGVPVKVVKPGPLVHRVFELSGLDRELVMVDELPRA